MSERKTSEILDLAADAIQSQGWVQGEGGWDGHKGAGLCLEGGIAAAMGRRVFDGHYRDFIKCPAYTAVAEYLDWKTPVNITGGLWVWNDHLDRTEQEVIETLRAAAAVERAKEESLEGSINKEEAVA